MEIIIRGEPEEIAELVQKLQHQKDIQCFGNFDIDYKTALQSALGDKDSEVWLELITQRKKAGLTQMQVAQALGITDSAVNQWEKGKTFPKTEQLPKLAKLLGCTVDELLKEE